MATLQLTDAQLMQDLAAQVKKTLSDLPAYWSLLISASHTWAVSIITSKLVARGYSISQIQSADQIDDYERALTLFMALKRAATIEGNSDINVKALDFTEGLKDVVLTQNGVFVIPAGPYGIPSSGHCAAPDDIFTWPPQNTSTLPDGQTLSDPDGTRW